MDVLWQRKMLDGATILHLTSDDERRLIADLRFRAPQYVVPNGIDTKMYWNLPGTDLFRSRYLNGVQGPLIMNHGRLSRKKGLDILVDAFGVVNKNLPTSNLVFVGPDDEGLSKQLRVQARRLGVEHAVHFVGTLKGNLLLEALSAADIWVLPSHSENFGNAVVEAMAAGKAVITSPYVNIAPEAHQAEALIMVNNKADLVAAAINEQLSNRESRLAFGLRARAYAARFDWSTVGKQLLEMYASAIERHRGAKRV